MKVNMERKYARDGMGVLEAGEFVVVEENAFIHQIHGWKHFHYGTRA